MINNILNRILKWAIKNCVELIQENIIVGIFWEGDLALSLCFYGFVIYVDANFLHNLNLS